MSPLKILFKRPTANYAMQRLLEKHVQFCQWLMGIGAGGEVADSGERKIAEWLSKRLPAPLVVIDAGANKGQFLNFATEALGDSLGSIHSFEPSLGTYRQLEANAPKKDGVILNHFALGKEPGEATLFYDQEGSGLASLTKRDLAFRQIEFEQSEVVKIRTLDDYCEENGIDHIHWLKIDVEGHEFEVLQGAINLFKNGAIDVVSFEFGGTCVDTRVFVKDFYQFFEEHGLILKRLTPAGYFFPIKKYRERVEQFDGTNFVAVKKGV